MTVWEVLGSTAPHALVQGRIELHWAVQVVAAAADAWLVARPDDSHTAMTWHPQLGALVGESAASGLAIGIRPGDLHALVIRDNEPVDSLAISGHTLAELLVWADAHFAAGAPLRAIHARTYDMPAHAVANGAPFTGDAPALGELARWYADATLVLAELVQTEPRSTPLRVWPHHFDLGAIVFLDEPGEHARQIGIGLSPGDRYYAEPYFYVTPHPIPDAATYPALASGGVWRREDFTGAILTATSLVEGTSDANEQHTRATAFLASAIAGARRVIG